MAQHAEPLSGGLVTARDASLLEPGELTRSDDLMYIPGSPSLHRCFGHKAVPVPAFTHPAGITYCGFDLVTDQLVILANSNLYRVDPGGGVATTLIAGVGGSTLDAVQYNDRHFLLTGTRNQVLLSSGVVRQHGMAPVTSPPGLVHSAIGGAFPAPTPGDYTYWTTEAYISSTETIESANTGATATVAVAGTTSTVTISRPPQVNAGATHWRVYRSAAGGAYPVGFRIGQRRMIPNDPNNPEDTVIDGASVNTGLILPTTASDIMNNDSIRGIFVIGISGTPDVPVCANAWTTSPANVIADDGVYAVFSSTSCPSNSVPVAAMEISGFAFGAVSDPVQKIEIEIQAQSLSPNPNSVTFAISGDGGVSLYNKRVTVGIGTALTTATVALVSNSGAPLTAGMFGTGFRLYLLAWRYMQIDYVKVNVYHAGTTGDTSTLYDAIQVKVGGQSILSGANGPPPPATTGDIFQESLVLNDVNHPARIAYSMAGNPDAFPDPYILNLQTKDKDRLACIRTIGSVCIFGLTSQVWRANYLPREEDAEFDRGRCTEVIDADNGIPGPFCAAKFVLGGKVSLFYLSRSGPRMTDGFGCETANEDLDWPNTVSLQNLGRSVVVNNAENQEILVYYIPVAGTGLTKCLRFQYHATHLKNGKLKAVGPCNVVTVAATVGTAGDGERLLYTLNPNGKPYLENRGHEGSFPTFSTRELYLGGAGGEWELHRLMVHTQGMTAGLTAVIGITRSNNPVRATSPRDFDAPRRGFSLMTPNEGGEGLVVNISSNNVDEKQVFDYLVLEGNFVSPATPLSA